MRVSHQGTLKKNGTLLEDRRGDVDLQNDMVGMLRRSGSIGFSRLTGRVIRIEGILLFSPVMIIVIVVVVMGGTGRKVVLVVVVPEVGMLDLDRQDRPEEMYEEDTGHQEAGDNSSERHGGNL